MTNLNDYITLASGVGGLAVAILALVVSFRGMRDGYKYNETSTLLEIFDRYEQYSEKLKNSKKLSYDFNFINLMNYVENLCFIHNRKMCSRNVSIAIVSIVSDFAAGISAFDLPSVLLQYSLNDESFEEYRIFTRRYIGLIQKKIESIPGTRFEEHSNPSPAGDQVTDTQKRDGVKAL